MYSIECMIFSLMTLMLTIDIIIISKWYALVLKSRVFISTCAYWEVFIRTCAFWEVFISTCAYWDSNKKYELNSRESILIIIVSIELQTYPRS